MNFPERIFSITEIFATREVWKSLKTSSISTKKTISSFLSLFSLSFFREISFESFFKYPSKLRVISIKT